LKNLRRNFNRFCFRHRDKGIPNLMLYVSLGSALVYLMGMVANNSLLYDWLCFDRALILRGQVWRLFSYVLTYGYGNGNVLLIAIGMFCYYSLGRSIENIWGTLKFNLFYLTGVVLQDIFCLCFGGMATVGQLNLSLFLAYATLFPDAQFLLLFFIPVKAWIFALVDLVLMISEVVLYTQLGLFPFSLYPLVSLLNYFLFFGKDVANVVPVAWRLNLRRLFRKKSAQKPSGSAGPIPFRGAGSYQAAAAAPKADYTHRCSVCGRTDVSNPELEFRYCSRCQGYHCYCQDHISNHTHVE